MKKKKNPINIVQQFKCAYVQHLVADFETCKTEDGSDVRVWAWGLADIFNEKYIQGTDIDSFLDQILSDNLVYDIGMHNLKFDGNYILPALFKRGYRYVNDKKFFDMFLSGEDLSKVFTHNITVMGQWFNIIIGKEKRASGNVKAFAHIWDTVRLFPETLEEVGALYCKNNKKITETQDFYNKIRPVGHKLTAEEERYLKADCLTLAEALRGQHETYGTLFRTRASKAFSFFKDCCTDDTGEVSLYSMKYEGVKQLKIPRIKGLEEYAGQWFRDVPLAIKNEIKRANVKIEPIIEYYIPSYYIWQELKLSYRGGISYVYPSYAEQDIEQRVTVLDVNSMYAHCLRNFKMPYGKFTRHKGAPYDIPHTTWIACARVSFKLKNDYNLPCIQIKGKYGREWLRESTDYRTKGRKSKYNEDIITFTEVDYQTFCENYDFVVHEWFYHFRFNQFGNSDGQRFVDKYYTQKQNADKKIAEIKARYKEEGNEDGYLTDEEYIKAQLERQEAKTILNSAYGKFGTKYVLLSKNSEWTSDKGIAFTPETETFNKEPNDPSHYYLPYASFVTSYARQYLVRTWNAFKGKAIYCDTDSIHALCSVDELPKELHKIIDWDETGELGMWKVEGEFKKARYIRPKTYIEVDDKDEAHVTCAGAPTQVKELMNWDNFRTGFNAWDEADKQGKKRADHSKLAPKHYPSGVHLEPSNYQILKDIEEEE